MQKRWLVTLTEDGHKVASAVIYGLPEATAKAQAMIRDHETNWSDMGIEPARLTIRYMSPRSAHKQYTAAPRKAWIADRRKNGALHMRPVKWGETLPTGEKVNG